MALTFVYGNSGNGKSEYMYQKIADMAEHAPYQHYFVVVPEQFTMSAQKRLVAHTRDGVILNIDVVSFERLAYRVFDELGVFRTVMEETGKSLVLRRIVGQNTQNLTTLRQNLTRMGYISELKSVLSEMMQYGISPDDLSDLVDEIGENDALGGKLRDILCIYRDFDAYLSEGYVTAERVLDLLTDVAQDSGLLRGAVLFFDGFTGFTPVQMKLIRQLMPLVSDLYVTVTMDMACELYEPAQMEELFYMSRKMVNALSQAAAEASFPLADPVRIEAHEKSRFAHNPILSHLEQNLFRIPGDLCEAPCDSNLRIYSLLSPRDELVFAAAAIRSLVRENHYRYRECAIVCSDVEEYVKYADNVFAQYEIPGFVDRKQSVFYHPLIELLRAVPEMAESDYDRESVFRYLRTGLCGFSADEVDLLENYCIEKGIRGAHRWKSRFEKPFAQHGRLQSEEETDDLLLERVNTVRERFIAQTEDVVSVFSKKEVTVRERTETLYRLLVELSVEEQLKSRTSLFEQNGEALNAQHNRQIYKIVIDLLDKMVDLLGEEVLTASDYDEILEAGLSSARVGAIPPGNDCVILGDIERTRLDDIKVLFLLGVNDGAIPRRGSRQSILSQHDREILKEHEMELAPGEREEVFLQRFYLYLVLTKPSDLLCLTCSRMDAEGNAARPSYLVGVLEKMFLQLHTREIAPQEMLPMETAKSSISSYLTGLHASDENGATPQWAALHSWYMAHPPWDTRITTLFDAHFSVYRSKRLDAALARTLYGDVLFTSVTRLERFGGCAFAHFLEYGLKLAGRREYSFGSLDMGTLFHEVLQRFGSRLDASCGWEGANRQQRDKILREALQEAVLASPDPSLFEAPANVYMLKRIYRILQRSSWAIAEQIRRSDFLPAGYEVPIRGEFDVETEAGGPPLARTVTVGRVDRMDLCEEEDRLSVRVIDYKSGSTRLELKNILYGRQLQLPVYLQTAMEVLGERFPGRKIVPAGIFYFHLDDPMTADTGQSGEERERELLRAMRPSGLVNAEPSLIRRLDRGLEEHSGSDLLPVSLNKDGSVSARSGNAVSTEDFCDLMQYVGQVMRSASQQMLEGVIEVNPYRTREHNGCQYCEFHGICGFDLKIPGYAYREERELSDAESWEKIREKVHCGPGEDK